MLVSFLSNHLGLVAIAAGILSATVYSGLENLSDTLILKRAFEVKTTLLMSITSGCTTGLLLAIIYYGFALYGFTESNLTPVQIMVLFASSVGLGYPLLGVILKLIIR